MIVPNNGKSGFTIDIGESLTYNCRSQMPDPNWLCNVRRRVIDNYHLSLIQISLSIRIPEFDNFFKNKTVNLISIEFNIYKRPRSSSAFNILSARYVQLHSDLLREKVWAFLCFFGEIKNLNGKISLDMGRGRRKVNPLFSIEFDYFPDRIQ